MLPYLAVTFAMLIWSASGIAIKYALVVFSPMTMIVIRFSIAVLLMFIIGLCCRRSEILRLDKVAIKDLPLFVAAGIAQPFLYYILETYTYRLLESPTVAEALLSTSPLLAPVFAFALIRERVTIYNVLGILVSTVGVLLLTLSGASDFALGNPWGVALAFAAVSSAVIYTTILRKIPSHYSSLSVVFYVQTISLILFIPTWLLTDSFSPIPAEGLSTAVFAILYLALFSSVIAFILFCSTVRQIGVTATNAFNNVRPVFTALIMLIFFAEQLPLLKWFGIILIIIGLFITQKREKKC